LQEERIKRKEIEQLFIKLQKWKQNLLETADRIAKE